MAYSSSVLWRSVSIRQWCKSVSLSYTPRTILVLPVSITKIINSPHLSAEFPTHHTIILQKQKAGAKPFGGMAPALGYLRSSLNGPCESVDEPSSGKSAEDGSFGAPVTSGLTSS